MDERVVGHCRTKATNMEREIFEDHGEVLHMQV